MPRITKVYTRTGDDGTTSLGAGQRVAKDSLRVETYGTVDELNSHIGCAIAANLEPALAEELGRIQNDLFHLGSDLCVTEEDKALRPVPRIEARHVAALEESIDRLSVDLAPLENFVLPGGTPGAAQLHVARTVCRRAERLAVGDVVVRRQDHQHAIGMALGDPAGGCGDGRGGVAPQGLQQGHRR